MKTQRHIVATTHVDRHRDRIAKEALEGLVDQSRKHLIPVLFNHDPRVPPVGRMIGAEIQSLPDGEFALVATSEIFEPGDDDTSSDDSREMRLREFESTGFTVVYDRSYGSDADQAVLEELSGAANVHAKREDKKAFEHKAALCGVDILRTDKAIRDSRSMPRPHAILRVAAPITA